MSSKAQNWMVALALWAAGLATFGFALDLKEAVWLIPGVLLLGGGVFALSFNKSERKSLPRAIVGRPWPRSSDG